MELYKKAFEEMLEQIPMDKSQIIEFAEHLIEHYGKLPLKKLHSTSN